ncbi:MAG: Fic family protein [Clostridiales bacterium]|nr:Fic family protein [Clostridiales bacterium]
MVTTLMEKLFKWMNEVKDKINPLILSSIFHYEFVFIHPFSDGNGRTARLWQTALLSNWKPLFKYIPIESIIRSNQEKYYNVIQKYNLVGNSNKFIEFMLEVILDAVKEMVRTTQETTQEKILNLIRDNTSITQKEMANILGMTRDGISYNIRILREKGILEIIGSTKNGEWKIYDKI